MDDDGDRPGAQNAGGWPSSTGPPGMIAARGESRVLPALADLAEPGWRPAFVDDRYLGFTNATAFSPTDVMPLAHWAKLAMAVQAILSIVVLSLVIANAVNILG